MATPARAILPQSLSRTDLEMTRPAFAILENSRRQKCVDAGRFRSKLASKATYCRNRFLPVTVLLFVVTGFLFGLQTRTFGQNAPNASQLDSSPALVDSAEGDLDQQKRLYVRKMQQARDKNLSALQTAFGSGKAYFEVHESADDEPLTVLDADVQIFWDSPKFRLHLAYETNLTESVRRDGQREENFEKWSPSNIGERVIIYDGSQILSVEFDREGNCQGTIYFGFAKMAVMRNAGFPFEDPIRLWTQALNVEGLDLKNTEMTPLGNGGLIGLLQKNTYRMRFVLFDKFGYDLRRVSSYRTGESQPFRDYTMNWEPSGDAFYIQRFTNTVTSASHDTGSDFQASRRRIIEYSKFQSNVELDPTVFELSSVNIPDGTEFLDKRANVEGGPKQLVYRDGNLVSIDAATSASSP